MLNVKKLIQITLFVLVLISSLLLGLSLESPRLIVIAVVGATIGFVVTDMLRLFRIEGVLANIASIVILVPGQDQKMSLAPRTVDAPDHHLSRRFESDPPNADYAARYQPRRNRWTGESLPAQRQKSKARTTVPLPNPT